MNWKTIVHILLCVVLAVYLGAALYVSGMNSDNEMSSGLEVRITGSPAGFVTPGRVADRLGVRGGKNPYSNVRLNEIDLARIEHCLDSIDNIERAVAYRTYSGKRAGVVVDVTPMQPVARIFDNGKSYYVNRTGKRLTADCNYKVDVPVVIGHFDERHPVTEIMPIIDYMEVDKNFSDYVSSIEIAGNRDIIIYPMLTGPVVNFGDTTLIKNKIHRLMRMYETVIPVVGAEFYDTLSVKWNGQVVATRHKKSVPGPSILFDTEIEPETIDLGYLDTVPLPEARDAVPKKK